MHPSYSLDAVLVGGSVEDIERPPPPAAGLPRKFVSFQALSGSKRWPARFRCNCVPPTAVTSGSLAGQLMAGVVEYFVFRRR